MTDKPTPYEDVTPIEDGDPPTVTVAPARTEQQQREDEDICIIAALYLDYLKQ